MTARIGDCTTLLELAFGLNLAIPAIAYRYVHYEQAVRVRLTKVVEGSEEKLAKLCRPAIDKLADYMTRRFRRKVYSAFSLAFAVLLASFVGLLSAAEHPNNIISDRIVDVFGVIAIVVTPLTFVILKLKVDATMESLHLVQLDDEALERTIYLLAVAIVMQRGIRFPSWSARLRVLKTMRKSGTTLGALSYLLRCPGFYMFKKEADQVTTPLAEDL